jgi:hypothetical protein
MGIVRIRGTAVVASALILLFVHALRPLHADARDGGGLGDEVKTAYLYKFSKYVQWPESGSKDYFTIAVIGDSGIIAPLRELAREKTADGRKIRVERVRDVDAIEPCHILFIAATERERLPEILKKVEGMNILTVGDGEGFAAGGVAVNFVVMESRLRFEINRRAAGHAGLGISSELLKLAVPLKAQGGTPDGPP